MSDNTRDLAKFGCRELDMAADLLKQYANSPPDFLSDGAVVEFNPNSGNVFLVDEDFNVAMLEADKLQQFFSCSECGTEGFDSDYQFTRYTGYCSRKMREGKRMRIAPTKHIVNVRQGYSADFYLTEDGEWACSHAEAYLDPACCSGRDSEGNISCGCYGQDSVICPAVDCTGILDHEIDDLFDRLERGDDEA